MKKRAIKVLFSIGFILIGILLTGFGFTTQLGHPISTICFIIGLGLVFVGLVCFIKIAVSNE